MRSLTLAELKVETEQHAGATVQAASVEDEEIHPEEISPELMYTAEHPVFTPRVNVIAERPPAENGNAQGSDGPGKRRRGRRGGRRGRGDDSPSGSQ